MSAWSSQEVELIVADYFSMLFKELSGEPYKKSQHRKNILPLLNGRSEGSIEFKHQNISAVLINLGQLYIKGYRPRYNYQMLLEDYVLDYLVGHKLSIEKAFSDFATSDISESLIPNFQELLVEPPTPTEFSEPLVGYNRKPIKTNYLEKEQRNQKLGHLGEKLAVDYEKWQLISAGKESLADQVRWISKDEGDGAGFDILSCNLDGTDKYVEVKTTKLGKDSPFFFTLNEFEFSKEKDTNYHLYRFFNFNESAKLFIKTGGLDKTCHHKAVAFKGYF